jgi:hypothetical protein
MKFQIMIGLAIGCLFSANVEGQDVKSRIQSVSPEHPRLFAGVGEEVALRKKIDSDALLQETFAHVKAMADDLQGMKPVERKMTGKRLLEVSRTCLQRMTCLGLAYRVTGDKKYAVRAQEEMLAAAGFTDWNPSHFLDVAEMTAALAIGYDWMYKGLDPEARQVIKRAIIEKGLKTSLRGGWWVSTENNWNQVCHGGLTLGALAILEDEPDLAAQIIERALENVPRAMAEYAPDGAYPEGPGYWNYGTTYNVLLISALESVLGTDFGLSAARGFLESSDYYQQVARPTGLFFNYSDCGSRGGVSPAQYWFADRRKEPSLLWGERQELKRFLSSNEGANYLFPFLILWSGSLDRAPMPKIRHWKADGKTPVSMHRSGWKTPEEIFVAIKGGSPGANHAHMDIGSFVMDAGGVRWAEDLGAQSYNDLESKGIDLWNKRQNSQRWDVFRLNNLSHNTLVVDGLKQRVNGYAPIVGFSDKAPMPYTMVDLTSIYDGQLASAKRGVGLYKNRRVVVQDEIETLDRATTVRWGMVTRADVSIEEEHRAILRRGDRQLSLSIQSPLNVHLELFETAKPPQAYDAPNKGTRMIGFQVEIPPSTKARFVVQLCPGDPRSKAVQVKGLADW